MKVLFCDRKRFLQYFTSIYSNFPILSHSFTVGWLSVNVFVLKTAETPLTSSGPLTTSQISLIGSIVYVTAIPGSLIFGWLSDYIGRKWTIYIGMTLHLLAFIITALSISFSTLIAARVLHGFACGCSYVVPPVFVSEIAEKEIRGILGIIFNAYLSLGVVISRIICNNLSFHIAPCVFIGIICSFFVAFPFVRESPQFLLLRGREEAAEEALKFFRGIKRDEEFCERVQEEFEQLKNSPTLKDQEEKITLDDLKVSATRKAIVVCTVAYCGKFLSGMVTVISYLGSVFEKMNTKMNVEDAAIIANCFVIPITFAVFGLMETWGRKAVIVWSSILTGIVYIPIILLLKFNQSWELPDFWGIIFIGTAIAVVSPGVLNLPPQISAEILPPKLRSKVCSFIMFGSWTGTFLVINYFLPLSEAIGMDVLLSFALLWCFFEGIFLWKKMPETKGKTYDEIAQSF